MSARRCPTCAAEVPEDARFCGGCGGALAIEVVPSGTVPSAPGLKVSLDGATLRDFAVERRCVLRFRCDLEGASVGLDAVSVHASLSGREVGSVATLAVPAGHGAVVALAFVPAVAGQHELVGEVRAARGPERWTGGFGPLLLKVGDGSAPSIHVHIDQSSARVIDNSRANFAPEVASGGLVADGEWRALEVAWCVEAAPQPAPSQAPRGPVAFEMTTPKGRWTADRVLAHGELATVYAGRGGGREVVLKVVDDRSDNDLMLNEAKVLGLLSEGTASPHLPVVLDTLKTADGRVGTVLERVDGLDLIALRERLPGGVPPRHLIWILRRALAALAFAHGRGILHGNLDPAHLVIRPRDHMLWVVDWCYGIVSPATTGDRFKALNEVYSPPEVAQRRAPTPASDLYALGKCLIFAAGGDPAQKTLPPMDERLERLLRFIVVESQGGRPQDAHALYLEVERVRERIWGPHTFEPFEV
ncbi:MAG: hypothetical protein JNJ59_23880 [Deltaproteobacteria bacterium]|nr:hypothetical protein [Deltaproteobacteria bacterium]